MQEPSESYEFNPCVAKKMTGKAESRIITPLFKMVHVYKNQTSGTTSKVDMSQLIRVEMFWKIKPKTADEDELHNVTETWVRQTPDQQFKEMKLTNQS